MTDENLAARQQALVAALSQRDLTVGGLVALPGVEGGVSRGLQAFRSNAQVLSARALGTVFPQVRDALGEQPFEAMAWAFWRSAPPERGDLGLWGGRLAGFLARQEGMESELLDIARLEWARHEAERAVDSSLDAASLELLASTEPAFVSLRLRPGLTLLRQSTGPVLVWRKGWRAESCAVAPGDAALCAALLEGRDLESALNQALAADEAFDFSVWLQTALREAWLQGALTLNI